MQLRHSAKPPVAVDIQKYPILFEDLRLFDGFTTNDPHEVCIQSPNFTPF